MNGISIILCSEDDQLYENFTEKLSIENRMSYATMDGLKIIIHAYTEEWLGPILNIILNIHIYMTFLV